MKRTMIGIGVLLLVGSLWAVGDLPRVAAPRDIASGSGSITFEGNEPGVGVVSFEVERKGRIVGSLVFAGEHAHDYPDIVIRLEEIELARFTGDTVRLAGIGRLHDEPMFVAAYGFDGRLTGQPDRFRITCVDIDGEVAFEAEGELTVGDLRVGD